MRLTPDIVARWFEFLEFYVAGRIPHLNIAVRTFAGSEFAGEFGYDRYAFPDDRFDAFTDYDMALAAYQAETPVRVLFEVGAADDEPPGVPSARFEADYPAWPAPDAGQVDFYLADGATLYVSPFAPITPPHLSPPTGLCSKG